MKTLKEEEKNLHAICVNGFFNLLNMIQYILQVLPIVFHMMIYSRIPNEVQYIGEMSV